MSDPLRYRAEFPILDTTTYLISNSLGAMPRGGGRGDARIHRHVGHPRRPGVGGALVDARARGWRSDRRACMGAAPGIVSRPSERHAVPGGRRVVFRFQRPPEQSRLHRLELPVGDVFLGSAARPRRARAHGAERRRVTCNTERLLAAIDEETLLVPISHVIFRSSFIQDAPAIVERAHRVGAHVILDTFQSLGSVPVDVAGAQRRLRLRRRAEVAVRRARHRVSVRAARSRYDAAAVVHGLDCARGSVRVRDRSDALRGPPYRFMNGTPNVPALYAAQPGLAHRRRDRRGRRSAQKSRRQTARLIELADARGWPVNTPRDPDAARRHRQHRHAELARRLRRLLARDILVDWRPKAGVRLSPHFYTNDEELDTAIAAVDEILVELSEPSAR